MTNENVSVEVPVDLILTMTDRINEPFIVGDVRVDRVRLEAVYNFAMLDDPDYDEDLTFFGTKLTQDGVWVSVDDVPDTVQAECLAVLRARQARLLEGALNAVSAAMEIEDLERAERQVVAQAEKLLFEADDEPPTP